mmetsp:Transcript_30481/g.63763  ORF Transcript_30481/g.63763 Transcript_30481/m.63763 type:complete len:235 (-) Transcript_30481:156-860(-)
MGQFPPLKIPQELVHPLTSARERVACDPQQDIQIAETRTGRIGEIIRGSLDVQVEFLHLLHVQTLLRQGNGRRAGENLGGVLSQKIDNSIHSTGMPVNQILNVINDAVDDNPILTGLEPNIRHTEHRVLLTKQQGHETEDAHEEDGARNHDEEQSDLLTPRLLCILGGTHDALVGDHKREDPRERRPQTSLHRRGSGTRVLRLGNRRRGETATRHDGGLGAQRFGRPGILGLGD